MAKGEKAKASRRNDLGVCAALLAAVLLLSFYRSLAPELVLFANDAPLGMIAADYLSMPEGLTGLWFDLNWLGVPVPGAGPGITFLLQSVLSPVLFAKFYAPLALFFFGLCAWFLFRQLKLSAPACVLGALAAALGSGPFSAACWGVAAHVLAQAWHLLALAAVVDLSGRWRWARVVLAGACVGMGIMEGFDLGAIFSLLVAACVMYGALIGEGSLMRRVVTGLLRTAVVAVCAALVAAHVLGVLVLTQIQGAAGKEQDTQTKLKQWDWATQWSLPKRETLGLLVPGLFGFRGDTEEGGNYWGAVGRNPQWDRYYASLESGTLKRGAVISVRVPGAPNISTTQVINPKGEIELATIGNVPVAGMTTGEVAQAISEKFAELTGGGGVSVELIPPGPGGMRSSGGSPYVGVIVMIITIWGFCASFRKSAPAFAPTQKKWIWFWAAVAMISLLLAFGRFAPFYQFLYALPYFSTIRNPAKFMHIVVLAVVVLFAYGIDGLARLYLGKGAARVRGVFIQLREWWDAAAGFERRWTIGLAAGIALSVAGWLIFAASKPQFIAYLQTVEFDEAMAAAIAAFSVKQAGWFVVLLGLVFFLMMVIQSGFFAGRRGRWGAICIGILLVGDLTLANRPWVVYWDYEQKYASNPVIETLRDEASQHRVALLPFSMPQQFQLFEQLYRIEWTQHLFLYYNIQTLDVIQMPRPPKDMVVFENALMAGGSVENVYLRRWQLTNTRYLLGPAGFIDPLNRELDSDRRRFRIIETFDVRPKPDVANVTKLSELTAAPSETGQYALFEFTGALPRASLYTAWEVITNEQATLSRLAAPDWNPEQTVLVPLSLPTAPGNPATNGTTGTVEFVHYSPKRIQLKTGFAEPAVLLLNDKYDSGWKVTIDGEPGELFRANYIMRGVYLPAGEHLVEFSYKPPITGLYVTISAMIVALILAGLLVASGRKRDGASANDEVTTGGRKEPAGAPDRRQKGRKR